MNTLDVIANRRSIRRFKSTPIPDEVLKTVLNAAIQAPSGKNQQPWQFVVVHESKRAEMVQVMRAGIAELRSQGANMGSSDYSANIMEQAPVTVFVFDPNGLYPWMPHSMDQNFDALVNTQSIGAAIQNMLLAAHDLGLGSLWICDVFYAYQGLCSWLGQPGALIAAVSLGYADENPPARPRKPFDQVVRYFA